MSQFALSDSLEYLCYGSTAIINMFTDITVRGSTFDVRICVYRSEILTSNVDSGAASVKKKQHPYFIFENNFDNQAGSHM